MHVFVKLSLTAHYVSMEISSEFTIELDLPYFHQNGTIDGTILSGELFYIPQIVPPVFCHILFHLLLRKLPGTVAVDCGVPFRCGRHSIVGKKYNFSFFISSHLFIPVIFVIYSSILHSPASNTLPPKIVFPAFGRPAAVSFTAFAILLEASLMEKAAKKNFAAFSGQTNGSDVISASPQNSRDLARTRRPVYRPPFLPGVLPNR